MTDSWKILNWDFVLDKNNNANLIGFFNPTSNLLQLLQVNNNTLFVTLSDTSSDKLDNKSFTAIFDKKTDSDQYSLCLKGIPFSSDLKSGKFSLMPSYVNKSVSKKDDSHTDDGHTDDNTNDDTNDNKNSKDISGMNLTQLGLVGGILATGTLLFIFGARHMLSRN
jgi:hypothetical protein